MGELCYRGGDTQYVQLVHQQLKSHACSIQKKANLLGEFLEKLNKLLGFLFKFSGNSPSKLFFLNTAHITV